MPISYANGNPNSDGYLSGISVPTVSALLSNIRDTLEQAGWTVDDEKIGGGRIEAIGDDNGDNCWVNFVVTNVAANEYELHVRGDLDGTGVTLSPDEVKLPFLEGAQARLYLTADSAAGCIFIQNGAAGGKSAHFGFLERLTDSPYSWMVGRLTIWESYSYMARDIWNVDWAEMSRYWFGYNNVNYFTGAKQHLWDSYTVPMMPYGDYSSRSASANQRNNPAYCAQYGAVDMITGLPTLSDYGYLIGRNDPLNDYYSIEVGKPYPSHFPGRVRFARTGLASVHAGAQFKLQENNADGTTMINTVIGGGDPGEYQGFLIDSVTA